MRLLLMIARLRKRAVSAGSAVSGFVTQQQPPKMLCGVHLALYCITQPFVDAEGGQITKRPSDQAIKRAYLGLKQPAYRHQGLIAAVTANKHPSTKETTKERGTHLT